MSNFIKLNNYKVLNIGLFDIVNMMKENQRLKIAIVSDVHYSNSIGGSEHRYYHIFKNLNNKNLDIHWVFAHHKEDKTNKNFLEIGKYHPISLSQFSKFSKSRRSIISAFLFSIFAFLKVIKINPDIIEANQSPFFHIIFLKIYSILTGKMLIATCHEVFSSEWKKDKYGLVGTFLYYLEPIIWRLPDYLISVSEMTKERLRCIKVDSILIKNGIDKAKIIKSNPKLSHDRKQINEFFKNGNKNLFYAGRFVEEKNLILLLEYFETVKSEFNLILIGNGPEIEKLQKFIRMHNLEYSVHLGDFFEKKSELYSLFKEIDIPISLSTREGFGIFAVEAIVCGKIPILLRHTNQPDIWKDCILINRELNDFKEKVQNYNEFTSKLNSESIVILDWEVISKEYIQFLRNKFKNF